MFSNPTVRLIGRAIVAGLVAALVLLQGTDDWSTVWRAAVVAGVLAAAEVLTPLNSQVGLGKK